MKAFAADAYKPVGDFSALKECELPKPTATGRDLLVQIKAVATNPVDYKVLANMGQGTDQPVPGGSLTVGYDAAGIVEAVGEEVSLFQVGDEVYFAGHMSRPGSFAEYTVVDERIVGRKPANLSFSQAASVPLTTLTAFEALLEHLTIPRNPETNAGKSILISGGAGGVATVAIEIAKKLLGVTVIATASRDETVQKVKELGADHVINHRQAMPPQIRALGGGIDQVDYILCCADLTPELLVEYSDILVVSGKMCTITPAPPSANLMSFFMKSQSLAFELMFARAGLRNEASKRQHEILQEAATLLEDGILTCREGVSKPLNLENLIEALELQKSGKAIGKITLFFP